MAIFFAIGSYTIISAADNSVERDSRLNLMSTTHDYEAAPTYPKFYRLDGDYCKSVMIEIYETAMANYTTGYAN